ncbi:MAG: cytosolic protein [Bacteroidetes bacterium]|nr:cytosolic protein [Bacteroidota bacterium]MBU2506068.1 cytosolic protein [Bacteroidota bacterium]
MRALKRDEITFYVEKNIGEFHNKRFSSLEKLQLKKILKRKNPYLFRAKNILTSQDLVKTFLDAHLSSQEETLFGDFLEGLAIFICSNIYGGWKSTAEGIDLEFDVAGTRNILSIKSGPNWGNSRQVAKMREDFNRAKRILRTSSSAIKTFQAVNGCCYGIDNKPDKGDYFKYCGQQFWYFISGNDKLFVEIIEPLGHKAKIWNGEFLKSYSRILNLFTQEFSSEFCDDGVINWEKLVRFNSARK